VGAGVAIGRGTGPTNNAGPAASAPPAAVVSPTPSPLPPGTRTGRATDAGTDASMNATVIPAAGWVRVNATVSGIPAGQNCRLVVVGRNDPAGQVAGGWIVSPAGEKAGTTLQGSAAIPPGDVVAVKVVNTAGQVFVTLNL
jgi:hypothetical protein